MTTPNPFGPNPFAPKPELTNWPLPNDPPRDMFTGPTAWQSVVAMPTNLKYPPNAAVDRATGEILLEDDNVTPYDKDNMLNDWRKAHEALEKAKSREADLRGKVVACYSDPDKKEGTENVALGMEWFVKVAKKQNYTLKSFDDNVANNDAVIAAIERLSRATKDSQGNELNPELGRLVAARLVSWKPTLSTTEYKAMLPGHREIIDTVLEIKPGAPTVTLVPPKEKK